MSTPAPPTPRVSRARELAVGLTSAGISATHDAREVAAAGPIVLVGPPRLAYETAAGAVASWRLLVIAGTTEQHTAWTQIDALLAALELALPLETADPVSWAPAPGADARPAYAATYTETVE